jgi:acyl carrier protein
MVKSLLPAERLERLREIVRTHVMEVLRLDASSPPARHDRLMDLGMDSLMAVQLRHALNRALALKRPLSSTLMFDHPTIDAIARYLDQQVAPEPSLVPVEAPARTTPGSLDADIVAAMSDADIEQLLDERLRKL